MHKIVFTLAAGYSKDSSLILRTGFKSSKSQIQSLGRGTFSATSHVKIEEKKERNKTVDKRNPLSGDGQCICVKMMNLPVCWLSDL